jgi:uncharacterized membrane protein (UPF0127 family)
LKVALVILLAFACSNPVPPEPATASAPPAAGTGSTVEVRAPATGPRVVFPDGFVVSVEIANDEDLRAQGLMYRDQLRPGEGMLFLFPREGVYPFWMKNTRIPLDIIWIGRDRRVADIAFDVPPCQVVDCPSYPPDASALYVLEVAGGVARQHGLKAGDLLRFEQTEGFAAR